MALSLETFQGIIALMKFLTALLFAICWLLPAVIVAKEVDLNTKVTNIAKRLHCQLGVTAIRIEDNKKFSVNGSKRFFMASTVKVPIAITLLREVDQGKEHLDREITFSRDDCVPGSGRLYAELAGGTCTMKLSLRELMRLMLISSDNSATDIILQEIRGPKAVASHLHAVGFPHIFIHRTILDLYLSASGLNVALAKKVQHRPALLKMLEKVSPAMKVKAWKRFESESSDSATSDEMAKLLVSLHQGKLLSQNSTHLLLETMAQCHTGAHRLKGMLPPNTLVAHKTGTWSLSNERILKYPGSKQLQRFSHDVGIITLPNNHGHIAIAFFVKSKGVSDHSRDQVIALVTKEIYHHFCQ